MVQWVRSIRQSAIFKRIAPVITPVINVSIIISILVLFVSLTTSITQQIETGERLLRYNLSDQARVFVQVQREIFKVLVLIPENDSIDKDALGLQIALLESRFFHLDVIVLDSIAPKFILDRTAELKTLWAPIQTELASLMASPDDLDLRSNVKMQLTELERLANTIEIEYNRERVSTLQAFSEASRQIPVTFSVLAIFLVLLVIGFIAGGYAYGRQVQYTETARQSNQFKDQFLATMSHELRTPLNAIIGFLGIMKMTGDIPEKTMGLVNKARDNAERLLLLINDILDISKIEAGRFELHPEWINARDLFKRWSNQTEVLATQKGIRFEVNIHHAVPEELFVDVDAMTKVVTNLLSNAVKFTKEGSVKMTCTYLQNTWSIAVTDTGIGVPENKLDIIFESFKQVDSSTRRSYGGTGLGLSIVKRLTTLMQGTIIVKSEEGKGSTFTVTFPVKTPQIQTPTEDSSIA